MSSPHVIPYDVEGLEEVEEVVCEANVCNPHLKHLPVDNLYHIGFSSDMPLKELFGDVKIVCMGGSFTRINKFAELAAKELNLMPPLGQGLVNISTTDRYCMFKVGPVLCCNHGMGQPSMSIILHEVAKLLEYAECENYCFVRMGTSGGLGVEPGTVVVSDEVYNGLLEPVYKLATLGKNIERSTQLDDNLRRDIVDNAPKNIKIVEGHTMCCDDFYEGQGRVDGAICDYSLQDKLDFLNLANSKGIVNIEMEGLVFAAFCKHMRIPAALVCVTLLDRLKGDQITKDHSLLDEYQLAPQYVILEYIKKYIL